VLLEIFPLHGAIFISYILIYSRVTEISKIMDTQMLVIFALVAALGLVTVVAVDVMLTMQEADARGCRTSQAFNASKGRCFQPIATSD
jgi:hypothetical protein